MCCIFLLFCCGGGCNERVERVWPADRGTYIPIPLFCQPVIISGNFPDFSCFCRCPWSGQSKWFLVVGTLLPVAACAWLPCLLTATSNRHADGGVWEVTATLHQHVFRPFFSYQVPRLPCWLGIRVAYRFFLPCRHNRSVIVNLFVGRCWRGGSKATKGSSAVELGMFSTGPEGPANSTISCRSGSFFSILIFLVPEGHTNRPKMKLKTENEIKSNHCNKYFMNNHITITGSCYYQIILLEISVILLAH